MTATAPEATTTTAPAALPTVDAVRAVLGAELAGRTIGGRDGFVVVLIREHDSRRPDSLAGRTWEALRDVEGWRAHAGTGRDWTSREDCTRINVHGLPPAQRDETRAERTMRHLRGAGFDVVDEATYPGGPNEAAARAFRVPESVLVGPFGGFRVGRPTHVYGEQAERQATDVLRAAGAIVCGSGATVGVVWPDLEPSH